MIKRILQFILKKKSDKDKIKATTQNVEDKSSDIERWSHKEQLFEDWNERTEIMSNYISVNSSVLEFGAAKLALKQFLPKNVLYTPSDIVSRSNDTIVCDLNKEPLPQFNTYDTIFFSGVLEYIHDVSKVIKHLSEITDKFIISYATTNEFPDEKARKVNGWVNNYSNDKIIEIFGQLEFKLIETNSWRKQSIYVFVRN